MGPGGQAAGAEGNRTRESIQRSNRRCVARAASLDYRLGARCGRQGEIRRRRAAARSELERPDPRMPVEAAAGSEVLARVPESAVIRRVDAHAAVVPPAVEAPGLGPGTLN